MNGEQHFRHFHGTRINHEPAIASSKFKMNITRDLMTWGLIATSFFLVIWWWDPNRDGIYHQIGQYRRLNQRLWEHILREGKYDDIVKLDGKIMLKSEPVHQFYEKPLENTPRSLDEILLMDYYLTCYNGPNGRGGLIYQRYNFYLKRNAPLVLQFIDPNDPTKQVRVDCILKESLIGPESETIQENETFTYLRTERELSGPLLDQFFEKVQNSVFYYNKKQPEGLIWKSQDYTEEKRYVDEKVLRSGQVVFVGGQFRTDRQTGKLQFHCSLISHEPETKLKQYFLEQMRWFEKMKIFGDKWIIELHKWVNN